MSKMVETAYSPDSITSPGVTLADILEEREMTQVELSERTGLSTKTINLIIKDGHTVSPETAVLLERALGIPAQFWNRREQIYRDFCVREKERSALEKASTWLKNLPINEMVKRGWVQGVDDDVEQVRELLRFFGVASVTQWEKVYAKPQALYRKSKTSTIDAGALAAWMRRGEIEAGVLHTAPYNADTFRKNLGKIKELTREHPSVFIPQMRRLCAEAGVAFVVLPEIPRAQTNGLTRWLSPNKALIQLCLFRKYADIFWFTFFHEAAHILKHGKRDVFVESTNGKYVGDLEDEADRFAADILIPPSQFTMLKHTRPYSEAIVQDFADNLELLPGIVVGRLQHEELLPWTHLNKLRTKYRWSDKPN